MNKIKWTKWKKGGVAAAVVSAVVAGTLPLAPVAFAQTPTPGATTEAPAGAPATNGTAPSGQPGARGRRGGPGPALSTIATALGIDESELQTELQAGKTISDVAASKGVALSVVSNAILTEEKARLAQDVADGKITQSQADERLANAETRINDMLTRTLPQGGPDGPGGPAGPGGPEDHGGPGGRHGGPGGPAASLSTVATALGMEESALESELQAGKTISDVAASKGVSLSTVTAALLSEEKTRLAQEVTDGKITQAQADERLANAETRINDMLTKARPKSPLNIAATALGITESALQTELQAGKTISDVAASKGVSLSTVSNALLADEKTRLAQEVTDGKITQAQADERLANAETRINDMLTKTPPQGGPGEGRGPRGPRQPGLGPNPSTNPGNPGASPLATPTAATT